MNTRISNTRDLAEALEPFVASGKATLEIVKIDQSEMVQYTSQSGRIWMVELCPCDHTIVYVGEWDDDYDTFMNPEEIIELHSCSRETIVADVASAIIAIA